MKTLCLKSFHDNFSKLFSYLLHSLPINHHHLILNHPFCNLKHITFLLSLKHKVSKSFPFWFTFGLVNIHPSVFLCLQILPLIRVSLYFLQSLRFSLTLLLALLLLSFQNHISLCVAGPFVHPQL